MRVVEDSGRVYAPPRGTLFFVFVLLYYYYCIIIVLTVSFYDYFIIKSIGTGSYVQSDPYPQTSRMRILDDSQDVVVRYL
jgi:hypothetical protein